MMFTIITAAWRVDGLKKVIECADKQTYKNWQHIIVNDNNSDIREFLKENNYFEDDYKRHVIDLHLRTHWYGGYARNIGVMASFIYLRTKKRNRDSEFIVFFDDDNIFDPEYLENFYKEYEKNNNLVLIGTDLVRHGKKTGAIKNIPCRLEAGGFDLGSFAYKRSLFDKHGFFMPRPERKIGFDIELVNKIITSEDKSKISIIHLDKPTFHFYHKKY